MKTKGYSLWLKPIGTQHKIMSTLIHGLSKKYGTPSFQPHVTIIGEVEGRKKDIISKTSDLFHQTRLKQFELFCSGVDHGNKHFKSVFINVKKTPELQKLYSSAKRIFKKKQSARYDPHISILYGILPKRIRQRIKGDVKKRIPKSFFVDGIYLLSTKGSPEKWHWVRKFLFRNNYPKRNAREN